MTYVLTPDCYRKPLLPDSIRLLRILPDEDQKAPIRCELFHYPLQEFDEQTHLYDAISYVWGASNKPHFIFIHEHDKSNTHKLPVTKNLYEALLRLRTRFIERIIWIDAVCINQEDDREKEHQIQLMAKIYGHANRVIVWLGEAADDSTQAIQNIRVAGSRKLTALLDNETVRQSVVALLERPWFRRIWVLQEVAAARHILIKCGPAEIDGYAFCLGLDSLEWFNETRADLRSLILSMIYLIRESIFRPDSSVNKSERSSLDICSLGELLDMYHAHEATNCHDMVYALLGMSTDDLSKVDLSPNYKVPWESLLQRLVKYLLSEKISVETWGSNKEIAVIKSKGCILGKISSSSRKTSRHESESVNATFYGRNMLIEWNLQVSAQSIRDGDLVCLLEGTSNPTIIRPYQDYFGIVMIAARPPERWVELLDSGIDFNHDFLLVWDWKAPLEGSQRPDGYENLMRRHDRILEHSTEREGHLDKAARMWNVALIHEGLDDYNKVEEKLQEAIEEYKIAFGVEDPYMLKGQYRLEPLSWVTGNGCSTGVLPLRARDGVNSIFENDRYSRTPLLCAAREGHKAIVELLLQIGKTEIDIKGDDGQTPLLLAANQGYETIVKLLLDTGKADVNVEGADGKTPLSVASKKGYETIVKLLLDTGRADVNVTDDEGITPLALAAYEGQKTIVELLLERDGNGIESDVKDEYGQSPLLWAIRGGEEAIVQLLLGTGKFRADIKDAHNRTPLSLAAGRGRTSIVKLLLETDGIEVEADAKDVNGRTALCWAVIRGHEAAVKLLLETDNAKVDANAKDINGRTPLFCAARQGHEAVVKLLLESGKVDIDIKDNDGHTVISWATQRGYTAMVEMLQSSK